MKIKLNKELLPVYFIFLSLLVFSVRNFHQLQSSALGLSVIHKIFSISFVLLFTLYFFAKNLKIRKLPIQLSIYFFYILLSLIGIFLFSPMKGYSFYKLMEITAVFLTLMYVYYLDLYKTNLLNDTYQLILGFYKFLIIISIIGALIFPSLALRPPTAYGHALIPIQLFGTIVQINADGLGMLAAIVFFVYWVRIYLQEEKTKYNFFWLLLSLIVMIIAQSRTAILAVFITIILVLLLNKKQNFLIKLLIIFIIIFGVYYFMDIILAYLSRGLNKGQIDNLSGRKLWWIYAINKFYTWNILKELFGYGFMAGSRIILAEMGHPGASTLHSDYMDALMGSGLVGMILLILFVFSIILYLLKNIFLIIKNSELIEYSGLILILTIRTFSGPTIASNTFFLILYLISFLLIFEKIKKLKKVKN